jgi:hypothetical protein
VAAVAKTQGDSFSRHQTLLKAVVLTL